MSACCSAGRTKLISSDKEKMAMKGRGVLRISETGKGMTDSAQE